MKFEMVTDGLEFPEGPIAMSDGSIILVEMKAQRLTRVYPDGTKVLVAHTGGAPNGAAIGPDGAIYVCNAGGHLWPERSDGLTLMHGTPDDYNGGSIQRVDMNSGEVKTLYTHCGEARLNGPNDIVFDSDGGFWFSDLGRISNEFIAHWGVVYYATIDGQHIRRGRGGLITPNGVGLSPDETRLYIAESLTARAWSFAVESIGVLEAEPPEPWHDVPLFGQSIGYDVFDSLAVEEDGTLCVASVLRGGISCFRPNGDTEFHEAPEKYITNICFGGADRRTAWVTASGTGKLFRTTWPRPGLGCRFSA